MIGRCFAGGAGILLLALAGGPALRAQGSVALPQIQVLEGTSTQARILGLEPGGLALETRAGERRRLALEELYEIRFPGPPAQDAPELVSVHLNNGLDLRAHLSGGEGETLHLRLGARAQLSLPYGSYDRLEIADRLGRRDLPRPAEQVDDRVFKRVGEELDLAEGIITGYGKDGLELERSDGGKIAVPFSALAAVLFAPGEALALPEGVLATLYLRDGCELSGRLLKWEESTLKLDTLVAGEQAFVLQEIAAIGFRGPRFTLLSSLTPLEQRCVPFFEDGLQPYYVVDRSIRGGPLQVAGKRYYHGIALRPICDLTYALTGGYKAFRCRIGIHDEVRPDRYSGSEWFGTVRFHIEVDGKEVYASPVVRAGQPVLETPLIDVSGAKTITLRTDFADRFPAGDHPLWLDPILLRGDGR